jgi:hypothetical protein
MKKVINLLEKLNLPFAVDKQIHFLAGFIISAIVILITGSISAGLIVTFFMAFYKEFKDEMDYAGFDWKDLLATMIGGVTSALIFTIFN